MLVKPKLNALGRPIPMSVIGVGLYECSHWNFDIYIPFDRRDRVRKIAILSPQFPEANDKQVASFEHDERTHLNEYGVVDYPEQLLEKFPFIKESPRKFCVSFVEIRREDEPLADGWRYSKWGTYYGDQNPRNEYIADDTHIEKVYTFSIYELPDDLVETD